MRRTKLLLGLFCLCSAVNAVSQSAAAIREGFITTDAGIRIHYLESGDSASKRALILIPGWRLPAYLWNEQLQVFSPTIRVIAIDPRSQGLSSKVTDGNTPESRAVDLHSFLSKMKVSRSILVGWSQGAQDVSAYLQQFGGDSVEGVVLVDSPVSYGPSEVDSHAAFAKVILAGMSNYAANPREYSQGMVHSIFLKEHPELDYDKLVNATLQTPTSTGIAMLGADIFGADRRAALAAFKKPSLVIASATSRLLDEEKEMAASIPKSNFVAINGTGHAVFVDDPAAFDEALKTFLQSLPQ
jgi:non-heme chloroperoxidase